MKKVFGQVSLSSPILILRLDKFYEEQKDERMNFEKAGKCAGNIEKKKTKKGKCPDSGGK